MRIIECEQGSEEWEEVRRGKPTASRFDSIITPAKLSFSSSSKAYACELVAERLEIESPKPPPSFWMENGIEKEPLAIEEYEQLNNVDVSRVGFCFPHHTEAYGCSPDGLVGDDGLIEAKCPKVETLIKYHAEGVLPREYVAQVQGQLLVTDRKWCDFFAWHEQVNPFVIRVFPDHQFQAALLKHLLTFQKLCQEIESKVTKRELLGLDMSGVTNE